MNFSKMWERAGKYYPVAWELVLLLLIIFAFWYPIMHYAELPIRIPTHFGASGTPDAWSTKSWGSVLAMPAIATAIYLFTTGMILWMASVCCAGYLTQ